MSLFKLIKQALDALYAEAARQYSSTSALDSAVRDHLESLSLSYGQLTEADGDPIDYSDPAARIAYLYCYVGAHADHVRHALQSSRRNLGRDLFRRSRLRVSSIGSGPGTDVFGIVKYLHENPTEPVTTMQARLFDRESAWNHSRKALKLAYRTQPGMPAGDRLEVQTKTTSLDVRNNRAWRQQQKPHRADLITLSYFVSEAYSQNQELAARWLKKLFRRIQSGAYVLYVDIASQPISDYFDGIWREIGLDLLFGFSDTCQIAYTEQTSDLAPYNSKFHPRRPKLRSDLCVQLLTKSA